MKTKLIAFDLDNTLAKPNKQISKKNALNLRKLANNGMHIVILSGKPSSYLLGVGRQLGVINLILSGENGADIYFGNSLPPKEYIKHSVSIKEQQDLNNIRKDLDDLGYDYFYQPNKFSLTPFYKNGDSESKEALYDYARYMRHKLENIDVYIHDDCVDFTPSSINKGKSLKEIIDILNSKLPDYKKISENEIIVFGDSSNDESMFNLNYNNTFIRSSFDHIKGDKYKYVNTIIEKLVKDIDKNE